jgi:hypothetical protein
METQTLEELYHSIMNLTDQYQIKDNNTILTVEKLKHDAMIEKQVDDLIKQLGLEIKRINVKVPIKYKQLFNIYTKTNKIAL